MHELRVLQRRRLRLQRRNMHYAGQLLLSHEVRDGEECGGRRNKQVLCRGNAKKTH